MRLNTLVIFDILSSPNMDSAQKYAYRYLIYQGTLCIRPIAHVGGEWWERWNIVYWIRHRKQICSAGQVANWLHNLALFSAIDFEGLMKTRFGQGWSGCEALFLQMTSGASATVFYAVFEFNEGRWPTLEEQFEIAKRSRRNE